MSPAVTLVSNNILQGYGPSESSCLPCLRVSGRASLSPYPPRSECKTLLVKITSSKCSLRPMSFVCKASSSGQRRNPDFSRQSRQGFSRSRNRHIDDRDSPENLDDSEFLSTKNGPLLSLSNGLKSHSTASPGPREREIVELFRKVQAQLRERAAMKEEKKLETSKGPNKESETVDSLLKLLRKHSVEQGKRKVNGGSANEFNVDRSSQSGQSNENKARNFFNSDTIVREEPQEKNKPSFSRPPSGFRRRSPVPRVKYEPIAPPDDTANSVPHLDEEDEKISEPHSEPDHELEPEFYSEPDMGIVSGLEIEHEEEEEEDEEEEEVEIEVEAEAELSPEIEFVDSPAVGAFSEAELSDAEEDTLNDKDTEKQDSEPKDLNGMKMVELRALAKSKGLKGFSKMKKSDLIGLLTA